MDNMQKLMALGLDYFDAELACRAIQKAHNELDTNDIAVDQLVADETIQYTRSGMFIGTRPIHIMMIALDESPISKN